MASFKELLLVAVMPVIEFLLLSALGLFLALKRVDILGETARHHLNQMVFYLFGPTLVCSNLAQTFTLQSFLTMWFMFINILLTFVIGSVLGWVLSKLTKPPKDMEGLVVSFCSAGNLGAMLIIIIPAICKQQNSPFGTTDICNKYGLTYASLSLAVGAFYIWLYVYNIVRISSKRAVENTNVDEGGNTPLDGGDAQANIPNNNGSQVSLGYIAGSTLDVVDQLTSTHNPVDHVPNSIKSLVGIVSKLSQRMNHFKAVLAPSTIAAVVGFFIGMISPLRKLLFGDDAPLHVVGDTAFLIRNAAIPSLTLILGANLLTGLNGPRVKLIIILGIIIVRYVFLPLLGILIVKGAIRAGFVQSDDLLFQFVNLLQYALPPALQIGTITQLFGKRKGESAVIMLWTYVVAPITVTLWSTFFMWLVSR